MDLNTPPELWRLGWIRAAFDLFLAMLISHLRQQPYFAPLYVRSYEGQANNQQLTTNNQQPST